MPTVCKWMPEALQDINNIKKYVVIDNLKASINITKRIIIFTETQLAQFQNIGKVGRVIGTRELIISKTPYFVVYKVKNEFVEILRIYHSAQKWSEE